MKKKRLLTLGAGFILAAFLFVACGGGSTSVPARVPTAAPAQADSPSPTAVQGPTEVPATASTSPGEGEQSVSEAAPTPIGYTWEFNTVDDNGAKPSLALDVDGVPHIAYILEDMPGFVKHAVLGDGGWEISTVATGYFYGPLDLLVSEDGVPQISWHNHDTQNAAFAALEDGQWVVRDIDHPGHDGWDNGLAVDSAGRPHIVSIDPSQFGSDSGVEYATFDGVSWTVEEVGSGPVLYEFGAGIAVDSQGRPHVVWFDDGEQDLRYAVKEGDSWQLSTVDSQGDVGRYPSLALDGQGNPAISYFESTGDSTGYIKVARWDGSQWNTQRVDKLENVFSGHFGARKISSLVLDGDDNPIVAYSDEQVIKLAAWDGSLWVSDTVLTADGDPLGQQVSLALDGNGVLHLTFADVASKGGTGVRGVVRYAKGTPGARAVSDSQISLGEAGAPVETGFTGASLVQPDPDFEKELAEARISTRVWNTDFSLHTVPYSDIFSGGVGRDGIPPLDAPNFTTPDLADEWLGDLEPVISFETNGEARAYPLQVLIWHEVVNDVVGGEPVLVTFCPLCNSAIVFKRTLDGVVRDFGVSGNLRNSDLIMWDRQTETWWQQFTGEGIVGELAGRRLDFLPASIISWADFKAAHPGGQVLSRDTGFRRPYGENPYAGYDRADNPPFLFDGDLDGRLLPKERVAAITIGDADAAFPFKVLEQEPVVNYSVGGTDLVVFFKPGTRSALDNRLIELAEEVGATGVFEATLDGRKLTFRADGDGFVDNETGSTWNILGRAVLGPLSGASLTPIVHANHFWFAWGAFKPDTKIYQGSG